MTTESILQAPENNLYTLAIVQKFILEENFEDDIADSLSNIEDDIPF